MKITYILAELLALSDLNEYGEKNYVADKNTNKITNDIYSSESFLTLDEVGLYIEKFGAQYELITVVE